MPPQPGVFALPYTSTHKGRLPAGISESADVNGTMYSANMAAGPSRAHGEHVASSRCTRTRTDNEIGTPLEDPKLRKRKDGVTRMGKEVGDRREEYVLYSTSMRLHPF